MPDFADKYSAHIVEEAKASGASQQKIGDIERRAKDDKKMHNNLAINMAMTFMEGSWGGFTPPFLPYSNLPAPPGLGPFN